MVLSVFFFFQAEDGIRDVAVTGVQTCALPISLLGGLPLIYGALAVGHAAAGIVPWILATWIHLVREIVKDIDDQTGDQTLGRRTLPLVLGARPASLVAAGVAAGLRPPWVPCAARVRAPRR